MSGSWSERWLRIDRNRAKDVRLDLLWLLGLYLVFVATGTGLRDPWPADEPRFALIARDMLASGDWFIPRVGGDVYADKPPLYFWLQALAISVTGSVRVGFLLPSLLASVGSLILVYDLARRLWNRHTALIAGSLLLLTVQFVWQSRQAQIDAALCFWTTFSLYGLLRHLLLGPQWRWYTIGWAAAGFGVITKGVGFLPLLVLIPWFFLRRRSPSTAVKGTAWHWLLGPLAFACAIGVWLVPLLLQSSSDPGMAAYRDEILFRQTVQRYVDAWHHVEPFWYFIVRVIPALWLPLVALLPWLVPRWREAFRAYDLRIALLLSWTAMVVLFFSFSAGKRGVYILPAVPSFVLACAPFVFEIARMRNVQRLVCGIAASIGIILAAAALYLLVMPAVRSGVTQTYGLDPLPPLMVMATLVAFGCFIAPRRFAFGAYAGAMGAVLIVISFWANPAINEVRSGAAFVERIERQADPNAELGLLAFKEQYLLQLQRPIVHFGHARWLEQEQEGADGAAWLNASHERQLIVTGYIKRRCFADASAVALGEANRLEWFLLNGRTASPCADQGRLGTAQTYVPPSGARLRDGSNLLSRDGPHHLRTDPRAIRSKRVAQDGE